MIEASKRVSNAVIVVDAVVKVFFFLEFFFLF